MKFKNTQEHCEAEGNSTGTRKIRSTGRTRVSPKSIAELYIGQKSDQPGLKKVFINELIQFGVVSTKTFEVGEFLLEYRGQLTDINPGTDTYVFEFRHNDKRMWLDATIDDGSLCRLVNDAYLQPNCCMKKLVLNGLPHLCLFALRQITTGCELRYNYSENGDFPWRTSLQTEEDSATRVPFLGEALRSLDQDVEPSFREVNRSLDEHVDSVSRSLNQDVDPSFREVNRSLDKDVDPINRSLDQDVDLSFREVNRSLDKDVDPVNRSLDQDVDHCFKEANRSLDKDVDPVNRSLNQDVDISFREVSRSLKQDLDSSFREASRPLEQNLDHSLREASRPLEQNLDRSLREASRSLKRNLDRSLRETSRPLEQNLDFSLKGASRRLEQNLNSSLGGASRPFKRNLDSSFRAASKLFEQDCRHGTVDESTRPLEKHTLGHSVGESSESFEQNPSLEEHSVGFNLKDQVGHFESIGNAEEYVTREPRKAYLQRRGDESFGFNFISGEDGKGVYISKIERNGVCDRRDELLVGDQLLWVNHIDLRNVSHEIAAFVILNTNVLEIITRYQPEALDFRQGNVTVTRNGSKVIPMFNSEHSFEISSEEIIPPSPIQNRQRYHSKTDPCENKISGNAGIQQKTSKQRTQVKQSSSDYRRRSGDVEDNSDVEDDVENNSDADPEYHPPLKKKMISAGHTSQKSTHAVQQDSLNDIPTCIAQ